MIILPNFIDSFILATYKTCMSCSFEVVNVTFGKTSNVLYVHECLTCLLIGKSSLNWLTNIVL